MAMRIYQHPELGDHLVVPRPVALDVRLSYAARGLLADILSRPDGWEANADALSREARAARGEVFGEAERTIQALFTELEAAGYMRNSKQWPASGSVSSVLEVTDTPHVWPNAIDGIERTPFPTLGQPSVVYAIGPPASSVVKIGTTGSLKTRLKGIQTGSPHKLHIRWQFGGTHALERFLHVRFDHLRLEGEWFDFGDADPIKAVSEAADEYYQVPTGTCTSW